MPWATDGNDDDDACIIGRVEAGMSQIWCD